MRQIIPSLSLALTLAGLVAPSVSFAGAVVDTSLIYSADTLKAASDSKHSVTAYDFSIGVPLGKRDVYVALAYGGFNSSAEMGTSSKETFQATDLGFKVGAFYGRGRLFVSSLTYNLKSTVKYNDGSELELRGTSLKFDTGLNYWFSDTAALSLRFYYYAPSLTESVSGGSLTKVSYARATMGQALGLSWIF